MNPEEGVCGIECDTYLRLLEPYRKQQWPDVRKIVQNINPPKPSKPANQFGFACELIQFDMVPFSNHIKLVGKRASIGESQNTTKFHNLFSSMYFMGGCYYWQVEYHHGDCKIGISTEPTK
jgi:hypothetical protein